MLLIERFQRCFHCNVKLLYFSGEESTFMVYDVLVSSQLVTISLKDDTVNGKARQAPLTPFV